MGLLDWLLGTPKKHKEDLYVLGDPTAPQGDRALSLSSEQQRPFMLLLVQMMEEDGRIDPREHLYICASIVRRLGMDDYGARDCIEKVLEDHDRKQHQQVALREFLRHSSRDERALLVEELYQVAISDTELHPLELDLLKRVASRLNTEIQHPIDAVTT